MKRTYSPHKIKRLRKIGFLSRSLTKNGRNIIKRRRTHKRKNICISVK